MKLNLKQISKIYKAVNLDNGHVIVMIDVSEDKDIPVNEIIFNIYCIDKEYNQIWQIREEEIKPIDEEDMFVYLGERKGEIIAGRYSGFVYKIDPVTGIAKRIGF